MNTDKIDPAISSADDLTKTASKSDVELKEEEPRRSLRLCTHSTCRYRLMLFRRVGRPEN